ncbi:16S rRNA (adenine(1518)-N(6)/adenine(1519)-N(6))-dimethyltransferase RsmA [Thermomicrobium sp. 4228-Ro]|uniref:16S rRNA (adenine(1518)-N(6)/adenine(1519)-N(6))- dimethyltransferase RsmA n=1 Tax=Thermomicrobium sp. 4228-Ro TaxID=2993937 RepID=UPI002248CC45|nr:16S rRNA (adenine(1518)-N(6)/adenine(1519)-N(6))-dimethyltransferase RsmA [Thermomicrobium sp. 4228-Ro]MCX2727420.1 16S rRNA (adenine(1518)-N(6)/adenine(1519)-N(6))-dimethyltransferase RsmA [Thermomicrobium sp. 4228-Ro]
MSTSSPNSLDSHPAARSPRGQLRATLAELGIRPRKALGQHFLHDRSIVQRIVASADLSPDSLVVEIGPGLGILTEALARHAGRVIAIELDDKLAAFLAERFRSSNVTVLHGDALRIDFADVTRGAPYVVVANLPYNVATPILERLLTAAHPPTRLVVMVQREVAERMVAIPPDMSFLSVLVQFFARPRIAFRVGPGAFTPPPKVESAVVVLEPREPPLAREEWPRFFRLVQAGFAQRRKQLVNALASELGLDKERVRALLVSAGIEPTRRAETLTLDEWLRLYRAFREELR